MHEIERNRSQKLGCQANGGRVPGTPPLDPPMEFLDKNAFQWDAYRPLVDRIPACTAQGVVSAQRGVSDQGLFAQEGCLPGGGVCPGGGCLPGRGGVCPGGAVSQHAMGQTPPVDRQTPVKT